MTPTRRLLVATAACLVLTSGCGGETTSPNDDQPNPALAGRTFAGSDLEDPAHRLVRGSVVRLDFDDGRVGAYAGCNHLGAQVRVADGVLEVGPVAMTEMACRPALMDQDSWLADFLTSRPTVDLNDDTLTLASGAAVLRLVERPRTEPPASGSGDQPTSSEVSSAPATG